MTGGDSVTGGVATGEYCTAAGTGCDAQINTGNYKTTYPYLELELPSSDHVSGGSNFTLPTVTAQFTATGAVGTTASETLSEFRLNTNVSIPIVGTQNVNVDAYPTSGNSGTPPYATPVALGSTKYRGAAGRAVHHVRCKHDLHGRQRGELHGDDEWEPHPRPF